MKFLFQKSTLELTKKQKVWYWIWNAGMLLLASIVLGLTVLAVGAAPGVVTASNGLLTFANYFKRPLTVLLNVLPVMALMALFYFIIGRGWIAFLATAGITLAAAYGNFYKILFRGDPFIFADFENIFLGLNIATTESYDLTPRPIVWISLAVVISVTLFLAFLVRGSFRFRWRSIGLGLSALGLAGAVLLCMNRDLYQKTAVPGIGLWAPTDYYVVHGFLYPFLQSANELIPNPPEGYDETQMQERLAGYTEDDIPEKQKVNMMFIMREANSDLTRLTDAKGIDWSAYEQYHALQKESYSGLLFTNIFAGGTVNSERSVMTGAYQLGSFKQNSNSYLRYLRAQGYTVEGSHPSYDWFYDRLNINRCIGLENYYFIENYYKKIGEKPYLITDDKLYAEMIRLFDERDKEKPYLGFNVTYQGHGPYERDRNLYDTQYVTGDYSEETKFILNNYLGSVASSNQALTELVEHFRNSEEPIVLCVFGDHNPWLGDGNSVYKELGINFDMNTSQGLENYYETEYLIWANDAAKKALGKEFRGTGSKISACYLMNEVFEQCGWKGPAFMQFMNEYKKELPIASSNAVYGLGGEVVRQVPDSYTDRLKLLEQMTYYWNTNFLYEDQQ